MAILFDVSFRLDDKAMKPKLEAIRKDIQDVFAIDAKKGGLSKELSAATNQAKILENALARATSEKGTSFMTLNSELHKSGTTAAQLTATLAAGGDRFHASLLEANRTLALSNRYSTVLGDRLKEAARVVTQSFKYSTAQMLFRFITSQIRNTVQWAKDLESEINKIQVVTGKTADEMDRITESTIKAAKELKVAAKDYAEASFIYYQQGLGDEEVARRTEITIKAAKAANQSVEEMSKQLTAIWNTYNMHGEEQARAASVGAKLAATTAIEFKDIAEAMQLSASAASTMGVSYDSLASIIATVGSTTKQSASIIGTAYKTIFSRFEQLKVEGTDGEVTLNTVSQNLKNLGISVLDQAGNLRELDDVINEVGNNWDNYTKKQQIAIAETVGGTRQYTQFLALMNNFDMYQKNLQAAKSETGVETLEQQYETALDSIEARATKMRETWSRAFHEVLDEDTLKTAYKLLDGMGQLIEGTLEAVGGLPGILLIVGTILSNKIGPAFERMRLDVQEMTIDLAVRDSKRQVRMERRAGNEESSRNAALVEKDNELRARATVLGGIDLSKERESLNIEMQKSRVMTDIKLANQNIDYQLKNAVGQQKIELQGKKEYIALLEQQYALMMDMASAAEQAAAKGSLDTVNYQRQLQGQKRYYEGFYQGKGANRIHIDGRIDTLEAERVTKEQELQQLKSAKTPDIAKITAVRGEITAIDKELLEARQKMIQVQDELDKLSNKVIGTGKNAVQTTKTQKDATIAYQDSLQKLIEAKKEIIKLEAEESAKKTPGMNTGAINQQLGVMRTSIASMVSGSGIDFTPENLKKIEASAGSGEVTAAVQKLTNLGVSLQGKDILGLTNLDSSKLIEVEEQIRIILSEAGRIPENVSKTGREFAEAQRKAQAVADEVKRTREEAEKLASKKYTITLEEKRTQLQAEAEKISNRRLNVQDANETRMQEFKLITGKGDLNDVKVETAAEQAAFKQNVLGSYSPAEQEAYLQRVIQLKQEIKQLDAEMMRLDQERSKNDAEQKKIDGTESYLDSLKRVNEALKERARLEAEKNLPGAKGNQQYYDNEQKQQTRNKAEAIAAFGNDINRIVGKQNGHAALAGKGLGTGIWGGGGNLSADTMMKNIEKGTMNDKDLDILYRKLRDIAEQYGILTDKATEAGKAMDAAAKSGTPTKQQTDNVGKKIEEAENLDEGKKSKQKPKPEEKDVGKGTATVVQGLSQVLMGVTAVTNAVRNMWTVMNNEDATFAEKMSAVAGSLGTILMMAPRVVDGLKNIQAGLKLMGIAANASLGVIALVIIAIGALIGLGVALYQHMKRISPEGQFKEAQAASEALGKSLEEATEKADGLRNALESYDTAKDKLDECTQGTDEFKEALEQANKAALDVLNTLELTDGEKLSDFYTRGKNGEIILNKEAIATKQANLDAAQDRAEFADAAGKRNLANKAAINNLNNLGGVQQMHYDSNGGQYWTKADTKGLDSLGNILYNHIDELTGLAEDELVDKLADLGYKVEQDSDAFKTLQKTIDSCSSSIAAADEAFEIAARNQVEEDFGNEKAEVKAYAARETADYEKQREAEIISQYKNKEISNETLLANYNDAMGTNYTIAKKHGSRANKTFDLTDGKGGKLEGVSYKTMAAEIAAAEALSKMTESIGEATKALGNLQGTAKDAAVNYLNNGNLNNLSPQQLDALKNKMENGTEDEKNALLTVFEDVESFDAAIQAAKDALVTGADGMVNAVQNTYKELFLTKDEDGNYVAKDGLNINADQSKAIANMMESAFGNGGQALLETFSGFIAGLDEEGIQTFLDTYDQINWANPDVGLLQVMLKNLGKSEEEAAEMAAKLAKALYQQKEVTLESAQATYESLHKIRSGLDDYSIVSDEDYKALEAAGLDISDYFTTMADGTHMLTGDAKELKSMIDGISFADFEQFADEQQGYADALSKGINYSDEVLQGKSDDATVQEVQLAALSYNGMDAAHIEEIRGDAEAIAKAMEDAAISSETVQNMYKEAAENAIKAKEALETAQFQTRVEDSGLDFGETENYAKRLADAYGLTTQQARDLAIQNSRLDKGINDLNDDIEDFKKALADTNKNTLEWSKTMDKLKGELADVFNIGDASMLSDATAEEILNSEDLVKALDGDIEALDRLRGKVTKDVGDSILTRLKEDASELEWQTENAAEDVRSTFADALSKANQNIADFETNWQILQGYLANGLNIDPTSFEEAMNAMIAAGHMTYEEVTSLLGSMGVSAKVHTSYDTKEMHQIPIIKEVKEMTNFVKGDGETPSRYETRTWSYVDGYTEVEETVPTYSIEMESGDTVSGGKINSVGSSSANIGSKAKVSQGSTTSGKASSGGSSKKQKPVDNHKRYDNIQHSIDNMTRSAERYKSAADDAWGAKKVANLEVYAKKLQAVGKEYNKLYQEARSYYATDSAALNGSLANIGMTAQYNSDGTVANSEQIQKAWDDWANARLGDDDAQDYAKEQLELLDKVNESAEKANEAFDQAIENVRNYVSARMEAIQYKIDFKINISEAEIKEIELLIDCMGELGTASGKALKEMQKVFDEQKKEVKASIEGSQEAIAFLNDLSNPANQAQFKATFGDEIWEKYLNGNGGMPAEVMEFLEDQRSSMVDQLSALLQTSRDMFQNYLDAIQLYMDEFDRITAKIDTQNAQLEMYTKILEVSGKAYTREGRIARQQMAKQTVDNNLVAVEADQAKVEMLQKQFDDAQKRLDDFTKKYGDPENYDAATAAMYNNLKNSVNDLTDMLEGAKQDAISSINATIDSIYESIATGADVLTEELMDELGGIATSLGGLSELYQAQYDVSHFYLDEYDKNYNLNKLEHNITQQIKDVQDPSRLEAYNQMLDDINAKREEGVQLTQKDIDILNAEFELQKLYDEYENAKNNKNSMRLARDASGNYSYVFSNTSGSEEEIEQKIEDQLYNIKKLHEEAADEMQSMWVQNQEEWIEYERNVDQLRYETDEKYALEVEFRRQIFQERSRQFGQACSEHLAAYDAKFEESALGVVTQCETMELAEETYKNKHAEYFEKLKENTLQYKSTVEEVCNKVGLDYKNLGTDVSTQTTKMSDANTALMNKIKELENSSSTSLNGMSQDLTAFADTFVSEFGEMMQAVQDLIDMIKEFEQTAASASNVDMSGLSNTASSVVAGYSGTGAGTGSGTGAGTGGSGLYTSADATALQKFLNDVFEAGLTVDGKYGSATKNAVASMQSNLGVSADGLYGSATRNALVSVINGIISGSGGTLKGATVDVRSYFRNRSASIPSAMFKLGGIADFTGPAWLDGTPTQPELVLNAEDTQNMLKAVEIIREVKETAPEQQSGALDKIKKFDTGGYTGDWGTSDGKLAVLHQKEMVLNATDTEHILQAVKMVRAVVESQSNVLRTENISIAQQPVANNITQPVAQDVKIEATFPNVSVAAEIEEALNNIVNEAVQYVSKK